MKQGNLTTAPKTPNEPQGRDTFQTPNYATELIVPFIPANIKFIWEPACGDGKIIDAIYKSKIRPFVCYGSDIRESKIVKHNIGNFLKDDPPILFDKEKWVIITNPPFSIKDDFIEKAFEYKVPFAMLINADYSQQTIDWIKRGCEKIVPTSRIAYITPNILRRIHDGELYKYLQNKFHIPYKNLEEFIKADEQSWITWYKEYEFLYNYKTLDETPQDLLYRYSSAQFHSMWLTYGFNLGRTETFVDLTVEQRKNNI
jgi:hypothetical protein